MQCVGEPEPAGAEGALAARQTVHIVVMLRPVPQQESLMAQVLLDGRDGAGDPRIVIGQNCCAAALPIRTGPDRS